MATISRSVLPLPDLVVRRDRALRALVADLRKIRGLDDDRIAEIVQIVRQAWTS